MAKRIQEQKEGERVVSKSRPAVMSVSSYLIATSSSAASSPIASKSPRMSGASGKPGGRMNLEASSFDAASTYQVRLKDANVGGLKEEQRGNLMHDKEQISEETGDPDFEPWYCKPVARTNEACGEAPAGGTAESISSAFLKSQNNKEVTMEHFLAISPHTIPVMEAVYDMVRKIYGRPSGDFVEDLDVNVAIWKVFIENQKLSKLCSEAGLNLEEVGQFFYALPFPGKPKNQSLCREYALPRDEE